MGNLCYHMVVRRQHVPEVNSHSCSALKRLSPNLMLRVVRVCMHACMLCGPHDGRRSTICNHQGDVFNTS